MEVKAYFDDIENIIINELMLARTSIKIAVAWFTDAEFIPYLVRKVRGGVTVEILLHHDEINREGDTSIDFSEFIKVGGRLAWCKGNHSTMHEKFCIIDDDVLIEGTFNWTYYAEARNDEHIVIFKECPELLTQFVERYTKLKEKYTAGETKNTSCTKYSYVKGDLKTGIRFGTKYSRKPQKEEKEISLNEQWLSEFSQKIQSLEEYSLRPKDYSEEFYKYYSQYDKSAGGPVYLFQRPDFDIQEAYNTFEEKYDSIITERKEKEERTRLEAYAKNFRRNFIPLRVDQKISDTKILCELEQLKNEFNNLEGRLRSLSKDEFCVNPASCREDNAWDYLNRIGVPCLVEKEAWYSKLLSPQKYSCDGESLSGKVTLSPHIKNIVNIENIIGKPIIIRNKVIRETSEIFQQERALYIDMLHKGYDYQQIQHVLWTDSYFHGTVGDKIKTIPIEELKKLVWAVCGLRAYSLNVLRKIERKGLKVKDIYEHLGMECPKSKESQYWWSCFNRDLIDILPINIFTEDTYFIQVRQYLHSIEDKYLMALGELCEVDLSMFKGNDPENCIVYGPVNLYWIPQEIIKDLPVCERKLEDYFCKETDEELLACPIDQYYDIFDKVITKK